MNSDNSRQMHNIWNNKINWNKIDEKKTAICMLPPPNVTGSLHIGHALNITLQDIKMRYLSLQGKQPLWIAGTDHAGIATQLVAQRLLAKDGIDYKTLSTEDFKRYIQQVKENHESIVCDQVVKMDTVINWDAYCFTLDPKVYEAVFLTFKKLFDAGLIYQAMRLTNWDPKLQTALSDLEVEYKTVSGNLYHIEYMTDLGSVMIATTRPETLLGDNALCVNPEDERYMHLIGKKAYIPITNKAIPIIADKLADMEFGTGVLKVTCAHDVSDFELGKTHNLDCYNIIDKTGLMIDVPEEFLGLNCDEARVKIIEKLTQMNVLKNIESIKHQVPYGEKSGNKLECILTKQWFINTQPLAQKSLERLNEIKFYPEYFKNICQQSFEKIEPWCISRQLVWGHQIPIWYVSRKMSDQNDVSGANNTHENNVIADDIKMFVCRNRQEAEEQAREYFQTNVENLSFEQDTDVLDTWFSSALWPFATQNFPYDEFIVNDFLVTGKDILFFWVARMIMMTLYMCDQIPFREVYLHGLVMDEHGKKMSKMVGNVLNPLDIIKEYNSDVIKLGLVSKLIQGRNVSIGKQSMELERNFLTKMENAVKFCMSQSVCNTSDECVQESANGASGVCILKNERIGSNEDMKQYICNTSDECVQEHVDDASDECVQQHEDKKYIYDGSSQENVCNTSCENILAHTSNISCEKIQCSEIDINATHNVHESDLHTLPKLHAAIAHWILHNMNLAIIHIAQHLDLWEMSEALLIFKEFFKNDFCDWFIEASKIMMKTESCIKIQKLLNYIMHRTLIILHPYAPIKTQQWLELLNVQLIPWDMLQYDNSYMQTEECILEIQYAKEIFAIISEIRSLKSIGFTNIIEVSENFTADEIDMMCSLTKCTVNSWSEEPGVIYTTSISAHYKIKLFTTNAEQLQNIQEKCQKEIVEQERVLEMTQKRLSDNIFLEKADTQVIADMKIRVNACADIIMNHKKILQLLK